MDKVMVSWEKIPSIILKTELAKRNLNYKQFLEKFNKVIDSKMTYNDLKSRISRGSFSTIFFLQCLKAMEVKTLFLDEVFFEEKT